MRLMTVQCLMVVALLGLTTGCSTAQPQAETAPTLTPARTTPIGMLVEPQPAAEIGYRLGWASPVKLLPGQSITSVTALGDMVFVVESPQNIVTALSANDGKALWKVNIGSKLESLFAPSRDEDQIFVHSAARFFTLSARTGEITAVAPLAASVGANAIYDPIQRVAIMSGSDGLVFAHSVDSNFSRWRYRLSNRIVQPGVMTNQDIFVIDAGGTYAMLEVATGDPLWRSRTLGPVSTRAATRATEVFVASEDGKLYAINTTTGRDTWVYLGAEQELRSSPLTLGRLVLLPLAPNNGILAIDAITGEEVWKADISATPLMTREKDILFYTNNTLLSVNTEDGSVNAQVATNDLQTALPIDDDGSILLVSPNGRLLKLTPQ